MSESDAEHPAPPLSAMRHLPLPEAAHYQLLSEYLWDALGLSNAACQFAWSLGEHAWFMWVNRTDLCYEYRFSESFQIPEAVQQQHIDGYLLASPNDGGLGLDIRRALSYVILTGIHAFLGRSMNASATVPSLLSYDAWYRDNNPTAGLLATAEHMLSGSTLEGRDGSLAPAFQHAQAYLERTAQELDAVADRSATLGDALRELIGRAKQPMNTGFLLAKVEDPNSPTASWHHPDLASQRPGVTAGVGDTDADTAFPFATSLSYLQYYVLASIEKYFFGGEPLAVRGAPQGTQLFKTYISGIGLYLQSLHEDLIGAAFVLGNYSLDASVAEVTTRAKENKLALVKQGTALARHVGRIARQRFHARVLNALETNTNLSDDAFVSQVVEQANTFTPAYVRYMSRAYLEALRLHCPQQCPSRLGGLVPYSLIVFDHYSERLRRDAPISYRDAAIPISDGQVYATGNQGALNLGAFRALPSDAVRASLRYPKQLGGATIIESRQLAAGELAQASGGSPTAPFGPFVLYWGMPMLIAGSDLAPRGLIEFFVPFHNASPTDVELGDLTRRLYATLSELSTSFELLTTVRSVAREQRERQRLLVTNAWISKLAHNIISGCGFESALRELGSPLPQTLSGALESDENVSPRLREPLLHMLERYERAYGVLQTAITTARDIQRIFAGARQNDPKSAGEILSLVRRMTELHVRSSGTSLSIEGIARARSYTIPLGAALVVWHLILNAASAAGKVQGSVRITARADDSSKAFWIDVSNPYQAIGGLPTYSDDLELLQALWDDAALSAPGPSPIRWCNNEEEQSVTVSVVVPILN